MRQTDLSRIRLCHYAVLEAMRALGRNDLEWAFALLHVTSEVLAKLAGIDPTNLEQVALFDESED